MLRWLEMAMMLYVRWRRSRGQGNGLGLDLIDLIAHVAAGWLSTYGQI
jgi:hypothetical protein